MKIQIRNNQKAKRLNLRRIRGYLVTILRSSGLEEAELSVLFVGDRKMKSLNSAWRGIDRSTDVLSFPMKEGEMSGGTLLGDVVISIPRTIAQAAEYGTDFYEELKRLLIHGVLHLSGYDHEAGRYRRLKMEKREMELADALKEMD